VPVFIPKIANSWFFLRSYKIPGFRATPRFRPPRNVFWGFVGFGDFGDFKNLLGFIIFRSSSTGGFWGPKFGKSFPKIFWSDDGLPGTPPSLPHGPSRPHPPCTHSSGPRTPALALLLPHTVGKNCGRSWGGRTLSPRLRTRVLFTEKYRESEKMRLAS
jgi:hypothetical protein